MTVFYNRLKSVNISGNKHYYRNHAMQCSGNNALRHPNLLEPRITSGDVSMLLKAVPSVMSGIEQ